MGVKRLQVMISSRNSSKIDLDGKKVKLSVVREKLKEELESLDPFDTGEQLFDVIINEALPPKPADRTPWEHSLDLVNRADIVLVLYNGDPGWPDKLTIGICHAELEQALSHQRLKAFGIQLPFVPMPKDKKDRDRFERFRTYWDSQKLWTNEATDGREAIQAAKFALHEALCVLVKNGRRAKTTNFDLGDALTWRRYDFARRKYAIEREIVRALVDGQNAVELSATAGTAVTIELSGTPLLLVVHAVPGALSTAAAKEMVGRPFHHDHAWEKELAVGRAGPIHVIGCHRGVTEQQAVTLLGRPDVTTIVTSFGILAIDPVSKVQCLMLRDCRDMTSTHEAVGRAFDWLVRSDESSLVVERADARVQIVRVIAQQIGRGQLA